MNKRKFVLAVLTAGALSVSAQSVVPLQELYAQADRQSRKINITRLSLDAADEAVGAAKTAMLPTLGVSLNGSYIGDATLMKRNFSTSGTSDVVLAGIGPQRVANGRQPTPHWGNAFVVQASQVIYAGGAVTAGIRQAELGWQMASLDVEKNRQEVRFLLTGYYLDLSKLYNRLTVVERNIDLTRQLIQHMEARHRMGTVLQSDITRYELQMENLRLMQVKLQESVAVINHQIATTLQWADDTTILPDTTALLQECASVQAMASLEQWQQTAQAGNLAIRQSSVASELADQHLRSVRSASRPSVSLIAENRLFGPYTSDLIPVDANVNAWFVGIGISYDISSLWHNRRKVHQARYQSLQSQEQQAFVHEMVENQVHACYTHLLTAATEVDCQTKQQELARQHYAVVHSRYDNDLALLTDMLDASNTLLAADMALVEARIDMLYYYYQLRYLCSTL